VGHFILSPDTLPWEGRAPQQWASEANNTEAFSALLGEQGITGSTPREGEQLLKEYKLQGSLVRMIQDGSISVTVTTPNIFEVFINDMRDNVRIEGFPAKLVIRNHTNQKLAFEIPRGTSFASDSPGTQDLMTHSTKKVTLAALGTAAIIVGTFCLNEDKAAPEPNDSYSVSVQNDPRVGQHREQWLSEGVSIKDTQQRLWDFIENNSSQSN
jgi:hypothetical protein